jgi:hypothetical protein
MAFPSFAKLFHELFRRYVTDGVPGSGAWKPVNEDIQAWGLLAEATLNGLISTSALINGYFTASVNANVLTIAVKTMAGADPSTADPVYADFRNATQTSGAPTIRALTAALSLTVSAGSTLGFANAVNGRIWVVLFDDAGTLRLGVMNAYGGNTAGAFGVVYPLYPSLVTTSTAEGGAGAADSAGVIYTGVAVTSKAFIVLGHLTWETALATAGNWSAAPDVIHQQRLGDLLPGDLVQRQASFDGAVNTGTTTTPLDDTIPQNTEGTQFMTAAITPKSKANVLDIEHDANYAASVAAQVIVALHQDAVANALSAKAAKITAGGDDAVIGIRHRMLAAQVTATTMKIRAGPSTAATVTFNGSAATRLFGGVNYGRLEICERMA